MKTRYIIPLLILFSVTVTSFAQIMPPPDQVSLQILQELKEIRASLERISHDLDELRSEKKKAKSKKVNTSAMGSFQSRQADPEKLEGIILSDDPDEDEIRNYIDDIIRATQGQNSFSDRDPQVNMLMKVGDENLPLLVDALSFDNHSMRNYHLQYAIIALADADSRDMIIEALPAHHGLIQAVTRNGWEEDAKEVLLAELENNGDYLPTEWIEAVARLNDEESYPLLRDYFIYGQNKSWTYKSIQYLPIEDLPEAVEEAWQRSKYSGQGNDYGRAQMAIIAVQYGHIDALEALVDALESEEMSHHWISSDVRPAIMKYTDARGSNEDISEWFNENHDQLKFDSKLKKFVVSQ